MVRLTEGEFYCVFNLLIASSPETKIILLCFENEEMCVCVKQA